MHTLPLGFFRHIPIGSLAFGATLDGTNSAPRYPLITASLALAGDDFLFND
jgi:hypothetical protein